MRLRNKVAIIYGAGGAIGGAVARAFAAEGARVLLTGRRRATLEVLGKALGAEVAEVDTLDEAAVAAHAETAGRIDISFNAMGIPQDGIQGTPLTELPLDRFQAPLHAYLTGNFTTARVAGRRMAEQGSGVILTVTATPVQAAVPLMGGMAPAWAGIEALTRGLAAELGPHGVRAVCLRTDGIPETATIDTVYGLHARGLGMSTADFTALMRDRTLVRRAPTLADVAAAAVFAASDEAAAVTGSALNLSAGSLV